MLCTMLVLNISFHTSVVVDEIYSIQQSMPPSLQVHSACQLSKLNSTHYLQVPLSSDVAKNFCYHFGCSDFLVLKSIVWALLAISRSLLSVSVSVRLALS